MDIPRVELAKSDEELLREIAATATPRGAAAFWWLGQHTFALRAGGKTLLLDPWFAQWESRQTPALLQAGDITIADYCFISHGHADHLCPESLRLIGKSSPGSQFFCPRAESERISGECGIDTQRVHALDAGETWEAEGMKVTAIKSKHEFFDEHPELGFPYLGYVVEIGGVTFYHAGDTILYDGLAATLRGWSTLDAMFLPINGRDAERFLRGCAGNMTFQEAAELAGELRPGLAVPAHWDMFVGNQEHPDRFVRLLNAKFPGVRHWLGKAGERVMFGSAHTDA